MGKLRVAWRQLVVGRHGVDWRMATGVTFEGVKTFIKINYSCPNVHIVQYKDERKISKIHGGKQHMYIVICIIDFVKGSQSI